MVAQRAIIITDFAIIEGHRSKEAQNSAYAARHSKLIWPNSPHNKVNSEAIDAIPVPFLGWNHKESFLKIKYAFLQAKDQLISEELLSDNFDLEFGIDWGWDNPHIQVKN